jgi:hypothetical protein
MTRRMWLAVAVLLAPGLVCAQAPVTINIKDRGAGQTVLVEQTDTTVSNSKLVDHDGKTVQEQKVKVVFAYVYRETYLAREENKAPTRIRREYEKAQASCDGETTDLLFHGKTVFIEKKDGKYHFSLENGKEVTEDQDVTDTIGFEFNSPKLERRYRLEREALPGKPVSLNDSWTVDVKSILAANDRNGVNYDQDRASGTGILHKVYSKDGKQFGILHFHITAPLKSLGYWPALMPTQDGSKSEIEADMDVRIDGQEESGTYKIKRTATMKLISAGNGRVGVTQTSNIGPLTVKQDMDAKGGQVTQTLVVDTVRSVRELPKK